VRQKIKRGEAVQRALARWLSAHHRDARIEQYLRAYVTHPEDAHLCPKAYLEVLHGRRKGSTRAPEADQHARSREHPYAIAGAMALNEYGYRRVTTGVDVLLSASGLVKLRAAVLGSGYVEKFPGSKGLRDTENGVNVDVLLAGEYPGDGKPKPVSFPDPLKWLAAPPVARSYPCPC
jgi:hypothetical protein